MASLSFWVRPVAVFSLALALAACGGGASTSTDVAETPAAPANPAPASPAPAPEVKALFKLAAPQPAPAAPAPVADAVLIEGRLDGSSQKGDMGFVYDAYVVTAVRTGTVSVTSTVLEAVAYAYGYGFPISLGVIENGADLHAYGGNYLQNALGTGVAITQYAVEKDRQYILVFKTFSNFTPERYTLKVGDGLRVEGRIAGAGTGEVPPDTGGLISVDNPRVPVLIRLVDQIAPVVRATQ